MQGSKLAETAASDSFHSGIFTLLDMFFAGDVSDVVWCSAVVDFLSDVRAVSSLDQDSAGRCVRATCLRNGILEPASPATTSEAAEPESPPAPEDKRVEWTLASVLRFREEPPISMQHAMRKLREGAPCLQVAVSRLSTHMIKQMQTVLQAEAFMAAFDETAETTFASHALDHIIVDLLQKPVALTGKAGLEPSGRLYFAGPVVTHAPTTASIHIMNMCAEKWTIPYFMVEGGKSAAGSEYPLCGWAIPLGFEGEDTTMTLKECRVPLSHEVCVRLGITSPDPAFSTPYLCLDLHDALTEEVALTRPPVLGETCKARKGKVKGKALDAGPALKSGVPPPLPAEIRSLLGVSAVIARQEASASPQGAREPAAGSEPSAADEGTAELPSKKDVAKDVAAQRKKQKALKQCAMHLLK